MPSFDIKSELNAHEVTNGVDQANRVIENRFDFKGTGARFELTEGKITLSSQEEFQLHQMLPILKESLAKRGVDLKSLEPDSIEVTTGNAKQDVLLKEDNYNGIIAIKIGGGSIKKLPEGYVQSDKTMI